MIYRAGIASRAEADLTHQYQWHVENAGLEIADRFLSAFDKTVGKLALQPQLGRMRRFRARELANIRSFPVGGRFGVHLIFYRAEDTRLTIERVMHGARNLPRRLTEPPGD
jgi:toxin ParE1/3/4